MTRPVDDSEHDRETAVAAGAADTIPGSPDFIGATLGDRYVIRRLLGQGGMGQVYVAEHRALGTPVAVKVMHAGVAALAENVRRFEREARALSLLLHPNVVRVLDFGQHQGVLYLVMELLEGEPLTQRVDEAEAALPIRDVVEISAQIARGLAAAHDAGIVHRDLKSDNVFLARAADEETVKLVDFGLAHVDDPLELERLTQTGSFAGTPQYMSPEQCRSLRVGPAADLYALGCVLTEMLQGAPPFVAANPVDIITRQLFSPPPPLKRAADAEPVPELLERLRLSLLAKMPEQRPASAHEVQALLVDMLDPARAAALLPGRSSAIAASREHRATTLRPPGATQASLPSASRIAVVRGSAAARPDEDVATALRANGLVPEIAEADDEIGPVDAVLLDVASDHDAAVRWLETRTVRPVLVCIADPSIPALRRLIAAGAAAVITHPVDKGQIVKNLERLLRRR